MPSHVRPNLIDLSHPYKNSVLCFNSFSRYRSFGNRGIWLVESNWGFNSKTRILSVMEFGMGSQVSQ